MTRDLLAGSALVLVGISMVVVAMGFPSIPVMAYGPGLFPKIVASGLILSGIGIAGEALLHRGIAEEDGEHGPVAPFVWLIVLIAAFALALNPLGFHVAGVLTMLAAIRLFGGGWITMAVFAPVSIVLLHMLFYGVLRVPLPWGLLLPVAW